MGVTHVAIGAPNRLNGASPLLPLNGCIGEGER